MAASRIWRRRSTAGALATTRSPPTARASGRRSGGDRRAAVGGVARRRRAHLIRGDQERLVLDRACAQQDLPVIAAGGERERRWDGDRARPPDGEDPVELGEAQVVADRQ